MNGIYIHIPFCIKKCQYCDFVSYENRLAEGSRYIDALLTEMQSYAGEKADTVYIGGGTPTALPSSLIVQLLVGIREHFSLAPDTEITVEANPGTCDRAYFEALAHAGVNRISLGVQSFVDQELSLLGRIHTAEDAQTAVKNAHSAGIKNVSLDLMFSIPQQNRDSLFYSLTQAIQLQPTHISCYSLTLCEQTPLYDTVKAGRLTLPDDETDRSFYALIGSFLKEHGYTHYEISNFARPGFYSRHNTKYWTRAPYIGLGVAAASFFRNSRYENPPLLCDYYQKVREKKILSSAPVSISDAMAEFMFLGLRMTEAGILRTDFYNTFKKPLDDVYGEAIEKLKRLGLLEEAGGRIRLTARGIDVSNQVFCEFL